MGNDPRAIVSGPGGGRKVHLFGVVVTLRIPTAASGGDFAGWEEAAPPGASPSRNIHHREDEMLQILERSYRVWCDGRTYELAPGAMAMVPRGRRTRSAAWTHPWPDADHGGTRRPRRLLHRGRGPGDSSCRTTSGELMALGAGHGHEFFGPRSATDP